MNKRVLPFRVKPLPLHAKDPSEPPRPISAAQGDRFMRVDVIDDLYASIGFIPGFVLIAQANRIIEGHLHYIELNGYGLLARLTEDSPLAIHVEPADRITPAATMARTELSFFGAVVEMYPRGLEGSRWVLFPKREIDAARPLYEAVAN